MLLTAALTLLLRCHPIPDRAKARADGWIRSSSALFQLPFKILVTTQISEAALFNDCLSLTLARAPVIAELPTHLLLAVAAKLSTDLWQSNEAAVHLWSCRFLWRIFLFQISGPESKQLVP